MSTLKLLLVASIGATSLNLHGVTALQGGGGSTVKLTGPSVISTTRNHMALDGAYTYEVSIPSAVGVNTVVNITDMTDAAQPTVYSVTIPAGQTSQTFDVVANYSGEDVLTVSTTNSSDSMDVTVL